MGVSIMVARYFQGIFLLVVFCSSGIFTKHYLIETYDNAAKPTLTNDVVNDEEVGDDYGEDEEDYGGGPAAGYYGTHPTPPPPPPPERCPESQWEDWGTWSHWSATCLDASRCRSRICVCVDGSEPNYASCSSGGANDCEADTKPPCGYH